MGSWENTGPMTFLLLRADADPAAVEQKLMHLRVYGVNNLGYDASNLVKFPNLFSIEDYCCHTANGNTSI